MKGYWHKANEKKTYYCLNKKQTTARPINKEAEENSNKNDEIRKKYSYR